MTNEQQLLKPKRGRPSIARAEALDRQVVKVARGMFLAEGYDAVAMEQVATEARVAKGTLYARHPSKESLFEAVVAAAIAEWSDAAAAQDHLLSDDIEQRLRHHASTICASLRRPDVLAFQRLVLAVRDRFPHAAQSMHDRGYRYIVELIANDVRAAAERDGIAAHDPVGVGQTLVAAITGHQIQDVRSETDPEALDRFAQHVVDLVIAGRAAW